MAADAWKKYNGWVEYTGNKIIDFDADTFKCALYLNTSNCADATKDVKADLTNEHANQGAPGYITGGFTCTVTWSHSSGTTTWDITVNPNWTATGGSIQSRWAVLYDDTPNATPTDPLIGWSLLDNTPQDVTVTAGNVLTIEINASGVLTVTGMA